MKENEPQDARAARGWEEPASEVDALASAVLDAAIEVHRVLGPGFLEGGDVRPDVLVAERLIVELKTVDRLAL